MSEKRIDPTSIPALFKRLGMQPKRGTFGNGKDCGCLTTALAIAGGMARQYGIYCTESRDWADAEFGNEYSAGLRAGWDEWPLSDSDSTRTAQGIADGAEAARLVFGEAAP